MKVLCKHNDRNKGIWSIFLKNPIEEQTNSWTFITDILCTLPSQHKPIWEQKVSKLEDKCKSMLTVYNDTSGGKLNFMIMERQPVKDNRPSQIQHSPNKGKKVSLNVNESVRLFHLSRMRRIRVRHVAQTTISPCLKIYWFPFDLYLESFSRRFINLIQWYLHSKSTLEP